MRIIAVIWALTAAGLTALGGCASAPATESPPASAAASRPSDGWIGGDPARLKTDTAACREESARVDVNTAAGYSDPRYGMSSAMAAAVANQNPMADTTPQIRAAAFTACMADKGWRRP